MQSPEDCLSTCELYLPLGQFAQLLERPSVSPYLPVSHAVHFVSSSWSSSIPLLVRYVPLPQSVQEEVEVAPAYLFARVNGRGRKRARVNLCANVKGGE